MNVTQHENTKEYYNMNNSWPDQLQTEAILG